MKKRPPESESDGPKVYKVEIASELLEETAYLYQASWELQMYEEDEANAVAFLVACVRLCGDLEYHEIEVITEFLDVPLPRVEFIVMELVLLHEERVSEDLGDDLYLLHLILPNAGPQTQSQPE